MTLDIIYLVYSTECEVDMVNNCDRLIKAWSEAAKDLKLDIQYPFSLTLGSGTHIDACLLVKSFGRVNGAIIVSLEYSDNKLSWNEIESAGYYFSRLNLDFYDHYDRKLFIETLRDWGWYGHESLCPEWCLPFYNDRNVDKTGNISSPFLTNA
jgi:hypothetical protein